MRRGLFAVRIGSTSIPKVMVRIDDALLGVAGRFNGLCKPLIEAIAIDVDGALEI